MDKIDFKKELKDLYKLKPLQPCFVEVPSLQYLSIDGIGDPRTSEHFQASIEALFGVSYKLKFLNKENSETPDYGVMPLEGRWGCSDWDNFSMDDRSNWLWTLQIFQPQWVSPQMFQEALAVVKKKKDLPQLNELRLEPFNDGLCAHILHIGPFAAEGETIAIMDDFFEEQGYQKSREYHREIYLSDFRRTAQEKLKTIIRQPIEKKS